jgi:outer membrane protein assembly factor BamB
LVACAAAGDPAPRADGSADSGGAQPDLNLDVVGKAPDDDDEDVPPKPDPCYYGPQICTPATSIDCYQGPPGTLGGACTAGKRYCNVHGTAYGGCLGQMLPRPDSCAMPTAWICDGQASACGVLDRLDLLEVAEALAVESDAGVGTVRSYIVPQQLVIEREIDGIPVWSAVYDVPTLVDISVRLAVDSQGATIVAARFEESPFPLANPTGAQAAVIFKLGASGQLLWANVYESEIHWPELAVSQAGDIWVAGSFSGEAVFGSETFDAGDDGASGFVLRLDGNDGTLVWARQVAPNVYLHAVTVGADDVVYVGGSEEHSMMCGHAPVLLAALEPGGELLWKKTFASERSTASMKSLVQDDMGYLYGAGRINTGMGNSIEFEGEQLDGTMFLAKFDTSGNPIWSRSVNDIPNGGWTGGHLALGPAGHVYWATQDDYSTVVRVYDPSEGHLLWERRILGKSEAIEYENAASLPALGLRGFAVRSDGHFVIAGAFTKSIDFGEGWVVANGIQAYFAVYAP